MTHINQRRDTAANWAFYNPVLQLGEVGWETDTRRSKLGDGTNAWNDLLYTVSNPSVTKADVGLGDVDNTSDMDKPVSTATQAELDLIDTALAILNSTKAPLASPALTGNPTAPTPATTDSDTSIATSAFVQAVSALARTKRWNNGTSYAVGDVVGYAGGVYRCTSAPTLAIPPALRTGNWEVVVPPQMDGWALPDPYFASDSLTNTWQTFWKTGTVTSIGFTSTAGEFESGKRALKISLASSSTQRLYGTAENLVKGGESVQLQARMKYLSGTAGQVTALADLLQNDETGLPEPLATGVSASLSKEGTQTLTTSWKTYTFTLTASNGKPRAIPTLVVGSGSAAAVILIDWIKVKRRSNAAGISVTGGTLVNPTVSTFVKVTSGWSMEYADGDVSFASGTITVNKAGWYQINGFLRQDNPAGGRQLASIYVNGSERVRLGDDEGVGYRAFPGSTAMYLAAGDTIDMYGWSSGAANFTNGRMSAVRFAD